MTTGGCNPQKAPKVDMLLATLSCNFRREVIHYFENCTTEASAPLDTVVFHIDDRVPSKDTAEVRKFLYHSSIPYLEETGWIDYDLSTNEIQYRGHENPERLLTDVVDIFSR